jgi:hypothetical protein
MRYFYKAVVQAVLLYGSESWTVNEGIKRQFQSFHTRVAMVSHWEAYSAFGGWLLALPTYAGVASRSRFRDC